MHASQIVVEIVPGEHQVLWGNKSKLKHILFEGDVEYKTLEELPTGGLYARI